MRNSILGTIAGLLVGSMGALAYSHYLGDGSLVSDLQSKLDAANDDLTKLKAYHVQTARQTSTSTEQNDELAQENADLRKQLEDAKAGAPAAAEPAPAPEVNINTLAGLMRGMMRGGGGPMQQQQRLFVMQARLKLTPEQSAKLQAAMEADQRARGEIMRQQFGGGRGGRGGRGQGGGGQGGGPGGPGGPDGGGDNAGATAGAAPAPLPATDNLAKAVTTVLTYQQQADYQKLQSDEKAARAETSATSQVNGVMPLLQLSDSQKEAAMQALYQAQLNAPDPESMIGTGGNPMAALAQQAQATQAVLAKVLTPDQMTLYQQQSQATAAALAQFQQQGGGRQRGNRNGANGANGGNAGGDPNAAGGAAGATAAAATPSTNAAPVATTDGSTTNAAAATPAATTNADGTPAAPAASTNAAPVTQ